MRIEPRTVNQPGLRIHTIRTKQFKTNTMVIKFRAPLRKADVTARALLPYVLQSSTNSWPTTSLFRTHLDDLYGASAQVDVGKKGESHILSFTVDVANERYLKDSTPLTKEGLNVLSQMLFHPLLEGNAFSEKVVEQEKRSLKQRLQAARDDKMRYATQRLIEEMCEGEAFALNASGHAEEVDAITPASLFSSYQRMLAEDTIDLYLVGDIDEEDLINYCKEAFSFQKRQNMPSEKGSNLTKREPKKIVEHQDIKQGKLNIGYRTNVVYGDPNYIPLLVMNGILGAFPHSKLFINVREKESLAYYASSRIESHKGLILIMSGVDPSKIERASTIINEQIKAIQEGDISDKEFVQTKAVMKNQMLETLDVARGIVEVFYQSEVAENALSIDDWFSQVESVSKEAVIEAAKEVSLDTTYTLTGEEGA
ncbi:EF-P 5-aminopentanol modification-associated protein YfmF [Jeotgalibacillus soli]|uniref:Peptidase M16 domain-containing protein n=1 Tax=Jeotgalibacillus soli TaxID=889306 RepID=A0A0C2VLR3_9BACL|nr:pitrilysin family protein [Jeotgalibacillus soli]KIL44948.1 peptidase M16 domain-containing protein [Jeotgalibacillus soli]